MSHSFFPRTSPLHCLTHVEKLLNTYTRPEGGIGKRAWNSNFSGGLGKRAWTSNFSGGVGKRAWNSGFSGTSLPVNIFLHIFIYILKNCQCDTFIKE